MNSDRQKKKIFYFLLGIIGLLNLVIFQNFQQDPSSALKSELRISDNEITATRLKMAENFERQQQMENLDFNTSARIRQIAGSTLVQDNEPVRIKLKRKPPSPPIKKSRSKKQTLKKSSTPAVKESKRGSVKSQKRIPGPQNKPKKKIKS